jgi:hypothetical protein
MSGISLDHHMAGVIHKLVNNYKNMNHAARKENHLL